MLSSAKFRRVTVPLSRPEPYTIQDQYYLPVQTFVVHSQGGIHPIHRSLHLAAYFGGLAAEIRWPKVLRAAVATASASEGKRTSSSTAAATHQCGTLSRGCLRCISSMSSMLRMAAHMVCPAALLRPSVAAFQQRRAPRAACTTRCMSCARTENAVNSAVILPAAAVPALEQASLCHRRHCRRQRRRQRHPPSHRQRQPRHASSAHAQPPGCRQSKRKPSSPPLKPLQP